MPQYRSLRGNLAAANYPFISEFQGRTIIVPQFDQNFIKDINSVADPDKDRGVPQVFYMHNVMPTAQGFQSISYDTIGAAMDPPVTDFDQAFTLRDSAENKALWSPSSGNSYIFNGNTNAWQQVSPLPPNSFPANYLISIANIHGRTIVFYEKVGAYEYDFTNNIFNGVTLLGLNVANIRGILSSTGYMLAYDDSTVYWSNTQVEVDFVPSIVTGAGSQVPNDLKGKIVTVLPVAAGFIVYTTKNAVFAQYSGNIRFPWIFKEIPNSSGVKVPEDVTWQANLSFHYVYTTTGLMKVDRIGCEQVFPEATDFMTAQVMEDYDELTGVFSLFGTAGQLKHKLSFVGSRYLILSYGVQYLTHALVYDTGLKRWGKVKIPHVDVFEWPAPNFFGPRSYDQLTPNTYDDLEGTTYDQLSMQQASTTDPKLDVVFLQSDGTMQRLNFALTQANSNGVLLIGKYQFYRDKTIIIEAIDMENVPAENTFTFQILSTWDGRSL